MKTVGICDEIYRIRCIGTSHYYEKIDWVKVDNEFRRVGMMDVALKTNIYQLDNKLLCMYSRSAALTLFTMLLPISANDEKVGHIATYTMLLPFL